MLRDVREQLKADALAKLKESCPTLFSMGWFKENLPKSEDILREEDELLAKGETDIWTALTYYETEETYISYWL